MPIIFDFWASTNAARQPCGNRSHRQTRRSFNPKRHPKIRANFASQA